MIDSHRMLHFIQLISTFLKELSGKKFAFVNQPLKSPSPDHLYMKTIYESRWCWTLSLSPLTDQTINNNYSHVFSLRTHTNYIKNNNCTLMSRLINRTRMSWPLSFGSSNSQKCCADVQTAACQTLAYIYLLHALYLCANGRRQNMRKRRRKIKVMFGISVISSLVITHHSIASSHRIRQIIAINRIRNGT